MMQSMKSGLTSFFLVLAYVALTLEWLWVVAIGIPLLADTDVFMALTPPAAPQPPVETASSTDISPFLIIAAGVATVICILLTVYTLIRLPKTIASTGEAIVRQATNVAIPVVTHHKKVPAKKRKILSQRITLVLQSLLCLVPIVVALFLPDVEEISHKVILTLTVSLAGASFVCFGISWLLRLTSTTSRTRSRVSRE